MDFDFSDFDDDEQDSTSCSFSDRINTILENTLKDGSSTPRAPCYQIGEDTLEVCLSGADRIIFYAQLEELEFKFGTYKKIPENIDKTLLVKILDKLRVKTEKISSEEQRTNELKEKYKLNAPKRVLSQKQLSEINKYEQARKKGSW
jgi:hypothetical protein